MRLLNTRTLKLKNFFDTSELPEYAILSHTWEEEEVTFQDMEKPTARNKKGYKKVVEFCTEADREGYDWAWIDTCCIDKTDHNELSEAINSMFAWYRDSGMCIVYISDFKYDPRLEDWDEELRDSRWFRRGWTLQELIAPKDAVFYDSNWQVFGTKKGFASLISEITGINKALLRGQRRLDHFSIAQKMSWAAYRQTTRVEDRAYSLLGLFNIHFPPTYGEGWKAFGRLQEELLKVSTDQSIFAWTQNGPPLAPNLWTDLSVNRKCSMLAPTPDCFSRSSHIIVAPNIKDTHPRLVPHTSGAGIDSQLLNRPTVLTNAGLQLTLLVRGLEVCRKRILLEALLNCYDERDLGRNVTICLAADTAGFNIALSIPLQRDNVPAWRVEPYYMGAKKYTSMSGHRRDIVEVRRWNTVALDLYPVRTFDFPVSAAWMDDRYWFESTRQEMDSARERIEEVKKARRNVLDYEKEKRADHKYLFFGAVALALVAGLEVSDRGAHQPSTDKVFKKKHEF